MQLLKDIYMVLGETYSSYQNCYAIRGKDGVVLVDTGADQLEL